ncbi:hypothetical protein [Echinicola sp. 20G]|uniref:hypothetical protein n=1 Tax=Echinicola sp. 20G TaxID=2781961 RepID=UPI00191102AB|nr:hypothetical protein [Echinicola sp. 20G]
MLQYFFVFLLLLLLVFSNWRLGKEGILPTKAVGHLHSLLVIQLIFAFIYHQYVEANGGDAVAYWNLNGPLANPDAQGWWDYFGIGYPFMYWLNYIPSSYLSWDILTGNLLYSLLGFLGFRYLFLLLYKHFKTAKFIFGVPWAVLLLYLPNLHFWTAGVGKEALCFFSLALCLWGLDRRSLTYIVLSTALVFMVRPYLAWVFIFCLGMAAVFFDSSFKKGKLIGGGLLLLSLGAIPLLFVHVGVDSFDIEGIHSFIGRQFNMLSSERVGSRVPMSNYSLVERLGTYWFRPLFFDAYNWSTHIASMENAVFILMLIAVSFRTKLANWTAAPFLMKFGILLFLVTTLLYANTLGNLGIMMRMKSLYMLFPLILIGSMRERKQSV